MIVQQAHVQFSGVHWYALQPGDGTRYQFGFIDFYKAFDKEVSEITPTVTDKSQTIRGNYPRIKSGNSGLAYVSDAFVGIGSLEIQSIPPLPHCVRT